MTRHGNGVVAECPPARGRCIAAVSIGLIAAALALSTGCSRMEGGPSESAKRPPTGEGRHAPAAAPTADPKDVAAAQELLRRLGERATGRVDSAGRLVEIVIRDGAPLTADDFALFGRLTDLRTLQIFNCRELDDDDAARLAPLKHLTSLALTNSTISDVTVEMIAQSFPELEVLDLSSNTNMSNGAMKTICTLRRLKRLTLVQNRFNDLGTLHLEKLERLEFLDLRGNMEAGDMTLSVVGRLPALRAFKHRSTTVTDAGIESLSQSRTLKALLMQDFLITGEAGRHLAAMKSLQELEIFRCPSFGSDGVIALKGMPLTRLQLRDLPMVDDQAMEVFDELPKLKRLYLHENDSISDDGLQHLAHLKELEIIDLWALPQVGDGTIEVLAGLPKLRELSIRTTGVTDAAVDTILRMKQLESLTFRDNGQVSPDAVKKLSKRSWKKLDLGQ